MSAPSADPRRRELLLIRADASPAIGVGHVTRCLALAQAWLDAEHGEVVFAMNAPLPLVLRRLLAERIEVHEVGSSAEPFRALVQRLAPSVVVVDGYRFGTEEHEAARAVGAVLAVFDDNREVPLGLADIIVNQNPQADALGYDADTRAELLLGLEHAMLRREFRTVTPLRAAIGHGETRPTVLVTLGGSDLAGLTRPLVTALARLRRPGTRVEALVGAAAGASLDARVGLATLEDVAVLEPQDDVVPIFSRATVVVTGAGSTLWELCALGVPMLPIVVAENQAAGARALAERGAAIPLGWAADLDVGEAAGRALALLDDAPRRAELSARARELVDGRGAVRVAAALFRRASQPR